MSNVKNPDPAFWASHPTLWATMTCNQYELYWLREAPGGFLATDLDGTCLESLDILPVNETLTARIKAVTPPQGATRLHLPYLSLRERTQWPTRQMELPVATTPDGRVVAGDDGAHQYAALLAGRSPVVFSDRRTWQSYEWDTIVRPMLELHQVEPPPGWHPCAPFEITWKIELPAAGKTLWNNMPHRGESEFLDQFRGLSSSIQRALRIWLPYLYFHAPERLAQPLRSCQYLAYSVLPTHPSRRKTQLTFHVLEPQRVIASMSRLGKPMAEVLRRAGRRCRANAIDATPYSADQADVILKGMHRMPRVFGALLTQEAFLVEEMINFAGLCHENRNEPAKARFFVDPGRELHHRIQCRLGRSYGGLSYENVVTLVLAAATAGLAWRSPDPYALKCSVEVKPLTETAAAVGVEPFSRESHISYATNQMTAPLSL